MSDIEEITKEFKYFIEKYNLPKKEIGFLTGLFTKNLSKELKAKDSEIKEMESYSKKTIDEVFDYKRKH